MMGRCDIQATWLPVFGITMKLDRANWGSIFNEIYPWYGKFESSTLAFALVICITIQQMKLICPGSRGCDVAQQVSITSSGRDAVQYTTRVQVERTWSAYGAQTRRNFSRSNSVAFHVSACLLGRPKISEGIATLVTGGETNPMGCWSNQRFSSGG